MVGTDQQDTPRTKLLNLATAGGLFLISTGSLFGSNINGILSDRTPAIAAALIFFALLVFSQKRLFPREVFGFGLLIVLSLFSLTSHIPEALNITFASIAFLAGANTLNLRLSRKIIFTGAAMLILLGFYQRWILFPEIVSALEGEARNRIASGRIFSAFILPGQYSAFLATITPLVLASALVEKPRALFRILLLLVLVSLALAGSMSGIIAVSIGSIFLLGADRRVQIAVGILGCIVLFVAVLPRSEVFDLASNANPFTLRWATWKATILGGLQSPIYGHGAGSFSEIFMDRFWTTGADEVRHPHSWPILVFFENGIVGLAAWGLIFSSLLRPIRDRSFRAAALAFFVATLLDVADQSLTLRALGCYCLGASIDLRSTKFSSNRNP